MLLLRLAVMLLLRMLLKLLLQLLLLLLKPAWRRSLLLLHSAGRPRAHGNRLLLRRL